MSHPFTNKEIQKAKEYMEKYPNYKVSDVQRVILKGYVYTAKLIESINGGNDNDKSK